MFSRCWVSNQSKLLKLFIICSHLGLKMSVKYIKCKRSNKILCIWEICAFSYVHLWNFHLRFSLAFTLAVRCPTHASSSTFPKTSSSFPLNQVPHPYSLSPRVRCISIPCCELYPLPTAQFCFFFKKIYHVLRLKE